MPTISSWYRPVPTTSASRSMPVPGGPANSATFGISDGGRLSITNQPRSSRLLAAWLRPAPDIPAMTTKELTRRPW